MNRVVLKFCFAALSVIDIAANAQTSLRPAYAQRQSSQATKSVAATPVKEIQPCPYQFTGRQLGTAAMEIYQKLGAEKGALGCSLTSEDRAEAVQEPVMTVFQQFQHGVIAETPLPESQGTLPNAGGGQFLLQETVAAYQSAPQSLTVQWVPSMGQAEPSAGHGPDRFEVRIGRGSDTQVRDVKGTWMPYMGAMDVWQGQVQFDGLHPGVYAASIRGCVKDQCQDWGKQMILYVNVGVPPVIVSATAQSVVPARDRGMQPVHPPRLIKFKARSLSAPAAANSVHH